MKKLVLAIAAGTCAMSVYAADPERINFNVQLAGEVPSQGVFNVTPKGWDGSNLAVTLPEGWDGRYYNVEGGMRWSAKSSYGPISVKAEVSKHIPSRRDRGMLESDSGDSIEYRVMLNGGAQYFEYSGERTVPGREGRRKRT